MSTCLCSSLWEEMNWKMKAFEEKYGRYNALRDDQSLKGQYNLLKQQQNMASDLREIEITLDVLSLCPNFTCKPRVGRHRQNSIPEYLIGPIRDEMIKNWVTGEVEDLYGLDGACFQDLFRTMSNRGLSDVLESECPTEGRSKGGWVLVYGFMPNLLPLVVAMFSQIGELLSCETSAAGNWAAFQYVLSWNADRALRHNETLVDGQVIGVTNQEDFIQKTLSRQRTEPRAEHPAVLGPIRALRKPHVETRSAHCHAPVPLKGWGKALYNIMDLLRF